jgi:Putative transposase, YhgA-like
VSDDFQQREDDIVWKVKVGEDWVYLYLLIEFQSSVDKYMALRMFSLWIRATLMRKQNYGILLPQVDDLQEIKVMLADRLEQWALAYIAEGELKGDADSTPKCNSSNHAASRNLSPKNTS